MLKSKFYPRIKFPYQLVKPIADFLVRQLKQLEKRKHRISRDDPFAKIDRGEDKASPDKEVTDRVRHESLSAIKDHMDRSVVQIRKALSRIRVGKYGLCESCGQMIDTDRLMVNPALTLCLKCEHDQEQGNHQHSKKNKTGKK